MTKEISPQTHEEVQAEFRKFLSPKYYMRYMDWPVRVILKHDSVENWEKCLK